jgi:hypothetical protein
MKRHNLSTDSKGATKVSSEIDKLDAKSIDLKFFEEQYDLLTLSEKLSDKRIFVWFEWNLDHPDGVIQNYDELLVLVGLNSTIQKWYKSTTKKYSTYLEAPSWLIGDDKLKDAWDTNYQSQMIEFREKVQNYERQLEMVERSIATKLDSIYKEQDSFEREFYRKYPVLLINKVTVQSLPYEITSLHTRKEGNIRKLALAEELVKFKRQLFTDYLGGIISYDDLHELVKSG